MTTRTTTPTLTPMADPVTDPDLVTGPGPDLVTGPGPDLVTGPGPDLVTGPGPDLVTGPVTGPGPDLVTGPVTGPGPVTERDPGYPAEQRDAVYRVIAERRDVRRGFRPDPVPADCRLVPAVGLPRDHRPGPEGTDRGPGRQAP
jgi:nicotinate-nucleotide--dimethylbenzimidazole phosphoribosyltransferase